jgi:hypothetical protein
LEKIFNYIKQTSIWASVLRIGLGIIFFIIGLILGYLYNSIFLIISILFCMAESVIIISLITRKSKRRVKLISETFNTYFTSFKRVNKEEHLSKAYKMFSYDKIFTSSEVIYNMIGTIDNTNVMVSNIKCNVIGSGLKNFNARIYVFEFIDGINIDFKKIKTNYLRNYRYEIRSNMLYLTTIESGARAKILSLKPEDYKNYNDWIKRIKSERAFIDFLIKENGGKYNETIDY